MYFSVTRPSALLRGRAAEIKSAARFNRLMQSNIIKSEVFGDYDIFSKLIDSTYVLYIQMPFSCSFFLSKNERRALHPPSQS